MLVWMPAAICQVTGVITENFVGAEWVQNEEVWLQLQAPKKWKMLED